MSSIWKNETGIESWIIKRRFLDAKLIIKLMSLFIRIISAVRKIIDKYLIGMEIGDLLVMVFGGIFVLIVLNLI
jgi:hypothetical protein